MKTSEARERPAGTPPELRVPLTPPVLAKPDATAPARSRKWQPEPLVSSEAQRAIRDAQHLCVFLTVLLVLGVALADDMYLRVVFFVGAVLLGIVAVMPRRLLGRAMAPASKPTVNLSLPGAPPPHQPKVDLWLPASYHDEP